MEHYANAVYRDSAYPEHNPLIDALPAPLNRENLLDILALESVLPENYHLGLLSSISFVAVSAEVISRATVFCFRKMREMSGFTPW